MTHLGHIMLKFLLKLEIWQKYRNTFVVIGI